LCINKFILGKIRLSNEMLCKLPRLGGIGFIDLKTFITSLQCSWIKKAFRSSIDVWRLVLNNSTGTDVSIISPDLLNKKLTPFCSKLQHHIVHLRANSCSGMKTFSKLKSLAIRYLLRVITTKYRYLTRCG
jgi:hypothetical protein